MRRKDKEVTDVLLNERVLEEAGVIRIAMVDDGEPYLVAMNFVYAAGAIYLHSSLEGRKIEALKKNNRVAFQTETGVKILPRPEACGCTTQYNSVFGTGRAVFIADREEKTGALDALMEKYAGRAVKEYPEKVLEKTLVIRLDVERMTGKKSPVWQPYSYI